jgi:WD and tetratricopeptide repeats protein 1
MVDDNRGFIRRHTWLSSQTSDLASVVLPAGCVRYFAPGHLPVREAESHNPWKSFSVTDVRFSADGANILSNIGGEQIYLFEVNSQDKICKSFAIDEQSPLRKRNLKEPTGFAKKLKQTANEFYHKKSFTHAIETYDRALQYCPHASVLYANRSAALMNRKWDGGLFILTEGPSLTLPLVPLFPLFQNFNCPIHFLFFWCLR